MNSDILRKRAKILHALRTWFWDNGYLEIQTPICVPSAAMEEHLETVKCGAGFLHTSPEFAMKKILSEGICRIYQITPCFRADEVGIHHSKEFTMLEWYRVGSGSSELMDDCISLLNAAANSVGKTLSDFQRVTTEEFLSPDLPEQEWFYRWVDEVEPKLTRPTIVYNYPKWQSALSRIQGNWSDRFEIYLDGIELANAFHEELSGQEIKERWVKNNQNRSNSGKEEHPIDLEFIDAVDRMPRCSGIAMGIDRLVMALTEAESIQETQATQRER